MLRQHSKSSNPRQRTSNQNANNNTNPSDSLRGDNMLQNTIFAWKCTKVPKVEWFIRSKAKKGQDSKGESGVAGVGVG